jgi:hypothetical protein
MLSEDEVRLFMHNGFLRLSAQLPPSETAALRTATEALTGDPNPNKLKPVQRAGGYLLARGDSAAATGSTGIAPGAEH